MPLCLPSCLLRFLRSVKHIYCLKCYSGNILCNTCFLLPPLEEHQADAMDASICFGRSENVKTLQAEGLEAELSLILYS